MPTFRPGFARPHLAPALDELRDEFDRLWSTLTTNPPVRGWAARLAEGAFPPVNVSESDDSVTIEAELPGLDAGGLDISVTGDELTLKGARPAVANGESQERVTWLRRERGSGEFERRVALPVAIDASRVEAHLVDGILTVTCPKSPQCQPRKVEVRSG